jgi:acyl-CoA thioester hydrolase
MREAGASYARLEERGVRLPVARVEVEYRRPVGYDALVLVETRVGEVRSRKVAFSYRILNGEDGEVLATAVIELVSTDTTGRPTRLPPDVRELLESLRESHAEKGLS